MNCFVSSTSQPVPWSTLGHYCAHSLSLGEISLLYQGHTLHWQWHSSPQSFSRPLFVCAYVKKLQRNVTATQVDLIVSEGVCLSNTNTVYEKCHACNRERSECWQWCRCSLSSRSFRPRTSFSRSLLYLIHWSKIVLLASIAFFFKIQKAKTRAKRNNAISIPIDPKDPFSLIDNNSPIKTIHYTTIQQ